MGLHKKIGIVAGPLQDFANWNILTIWLQQAAPQYFEMTIPIHTPRPMHPT